MGARDGCKARGTHVHVQVSWVGVGGATPTLVGRVKHHVAKKWPKVPKSAQWPPNGQGGHMVALGGPPNTRKPPPKLLGHPLAVFWAWLPLLNFC